MAPGAGRNIRMIDGSRRRRAVQIRAQGAQTGLFQRIFTRIKEERAQLEGCIRELEQRQKNSVSQADMAKELVQRYLNTACTSRELLVSLIQRVELTKDKEIIIKFRFAELQDV